MNNRWVGRRRAILCGLRGAERVRWASGRASSLRRHCGPSTLMLRDREGSLSPAGAETTPVLNTMLRLRNLDGVGLRGRVRHTIDQP
jgi:hypothetical protein